MKKKSRMLLGAAAVIAAVLIVGNKSRTYTGPDALLEKAREEFPGGTVVSYAGTSVKENLALHWFISGDEYQTHDYLPMEYVIVGEDEYAFIRTSQATNFIRDTAVLRWADGYAFLINNPKCTAVHITGEAGTVREEIEEDAYPYVFYYDGRTSKVNFLDAEGNEIII